MSWNDRETRDMCQPAFAALLRTCLERMREMDAEHPGEGYAPWLAGYLGYAAGLTTDETTEMLRLMIGNRR